MERDFRQPLIAEQDFEEVYPHCEFAPLVALALAAGAWIKRQIEKKPRRLHAAARPRHLVP